MGTVRYDFWRVALDAFAAHPITGLGQDNFLDYYIPRRRSDQEPSYVHSLELRLLTHTGVVGFVLFAVFLVAALAAALPGRRRAGLEAAVAGAALLPLVVWVVHGSLDWFWELPALSGTGARLPRDGRRPERRHRPRSRRMPPSGQSLPPDAS